MNMDFSRIDFPCAFVLASNAVVGVEYFDITVAEIVCIAIDKTIINAKAGKVFDSISGMDVCLHTIFCDEQMVSSAHNRMVGVIE